MDDFVSDEKGEARSRVGGCCFRDSVRGALPARLPAAAGSPMRSAPTG